MLMGKLVNLRAVEPADYELLWRWVNMPEIMKYWGRPGNTQSLAEVAEQERMQAARGNSAKFMVETRDGRAIGQIDYYELDWQKRSAWVSILIADKEYWGGGYGTDAMRTLVRYLFRQLGLHRVSLNVHESNLRAQRSYQKVGFVREGVMRDWAYFDGQWMNAVLMSVLESDFAE
jgi:RimJ/RimL family protein N-acetyltransferase